MPEETYARPFAATLQEIRKGELVVELADLMRGLVAGVIEVGKPGTLTLTIKVKPAARRDEAVIVEDDVVVKQPRPDRPASIFFASAEGDLSRHNPNQPELPLRQVEES